MEQDVLPDERGLAEIRKAPPWLMGAFLILISLGAGAVLLFSTPWGIGVGYDSVFYLSAADNLLHGLGLSRLGGGGEVMPLTHFPPLYPLLLAVVTGVAGQTAAEAARWMAGVLYGLDLGLIGFLIYRYSRVWWAAIAGAVIALLSPVLLEVNLMAMSEPLYLSLLLAALASLTTFFERGGRGWLMVAGFMAGLATLTRYVGASLVVTGALALLLWDGRRPKRRLGETMIFTALGVVPTLVWYARNFILTGTATNRVLGYHPPSAEALRRGLVSVASWILPRGLPLRLGVFASGTLAVGVVAFLLWDIARARHRDGFSWTAMRRFTWLIGFHSLIYLLFLGTSLTFFDASTPLSGRILTPLYVAGLLLTFIVVGRLVSHLDRPFPVAMAFGVVILIVSASYIVRSASLLAEMRLEGRGFTSRTWQTSETVGLVRSLDPEMVLYSNASFPLSFLTGRAVYWVPEKLDPVRAQPRPDYTLQMEAMHDRLGEPGSALVLYHPEALSPLLPSLDELTTGLVLFAKTQDGAIYVRPGGAEPEVES